MMDCATDWAAAMAPMDRPARWLSYQQDMDAEKTVQVEREMNGCIYVLQCLLHVIKNMCHLFLMKILKRRATKCGVTVGKTDYAYCVTVGITNYAYSRLLTTFA